MQSEDKYMKIKIGIIGYGNLGKGIECALQHTDDMDLVGVFTRRNPSDVQVQSDVPVYRLDDVYGMKDEIDVLILCGGSANDLPLQSVQFAKDFNIVDSFDTHAKIPEHFEKVDAVSKEHQHVSVISAGWDPGLFSLQRLYGQAVLPHGVDYTFWGRGVSQGHSDAIRRIEGVIDARQYTVPVAASLERVRNNEEPVLSTRDKHTRECYVVVAEGVDKAEVANKIKTMPNYFDEYDTTVHFITLDEMKRDHGALPHGGVVIRSGKTGMDLEHSHLMEYRLDLSSNPEFTSSVLVAYARAAYRLYQEGQYGCKTVFDIAPAYLHEATVAELRKKLL